MSLKRVCLCHRIDRKMSCSQTNYKLDEAQAICSELCSIKKAISTGEKERQDLIQVQVTWPHSSDTLCWPLVPENFLSAAASQRNICRHVTHHQDEQESLRTVTYVLTNGLWVPSCYFRGISWPGDKRNQRFPQVLLADFLKRMIVSRRALQSWRWTSRAACLSVTRPARRQTTLETLGTRAICSNTVTLAVRLTSWER